MAIRITCPGCKTSLTLDDHARGTKIRCAECAKVLSIPAASKDAIQEGRKLKARAPAASSQEDEADENERPGKKKKKGKKGKSGSPALLFIAGGAVLVVLLIAVGWLSAYFLMRTAPTTPKENQQAKLEPKDKKEPEAGNAQKAGGGGEPKDQKPNIPVKEKENENPGIRIAPKIEEGSPTKKGGAGIVQNIRGAVCRTERKSELRQLFISFTQFCDDYKGIARTQENFLQHIKTFGPIRDAVKEGYYKINVTARLDGANIIAYERDKDHQGYLSVMGNGDVRYVPEAEWKAALGIK